MTISIKPKCDMLIDQNTYIGDDPIGHACMNDATYTDGEYMICEHCLKMLKDAPERVSFPAIGTATTWKKDIERTFDRLTNKNKKG